MIKKALFLTASIIAVAFMVHPVYAYSFNSSNLIADNNFDNVNSMNASEINSWLNTTYGNSSCISTDAGFSAPDPTGYSPSNGFTYSSPVSAGQVIYNAAQAYGLNPQVLLVTLEKEQSLVSGGNGCSILRYTGATGYGCPDGGTTHSYSYGQSGSTLPSPLYYINGSPVTSVSGTCVDNALAAGFSEQIIHAAWLLRFGEQRSQGNINWDVQLTNTPEQGDVWNNSDDPQTCYGGPMVQGTWQVCPGGSSTYYDGYTTIDGSSVYMSDGATAALYWYTPHFSGNQNFDSIYAGWFGSPTDYYADNNASVSVYTDNSKSHQVDANTINANQKLWVVMSFRNNGSVTWTNSGSNPVRLAIMSSTPSAFQDASWISNTRVVNMDQSSVGPGGTATFSFWYDAPLVSHLSDYATTFGLVAENAATITDVDPIIYTQVNPPTYFTSNSSITSYTDSNKTQQISTNSMTTQSKVWVVMSFLNNGSAIWNNSGPGAVRIATSDSNDPFCDQTWVNCSRPTNMDQSSVGPGGTATFSFWYDAPLVSHLSAYSPQFSIVSEGVASITGDQRTIYTNVNPYLWADNNSSVTDYSSNSASSPSPGLTNTMTSGSQAWVVISFRNNGNTIWTNSGSNPVRLAIMSSTPSAFQDASWISNTRVVNMDQSSVGPGGTATFSFWYDAPTVSHGSAYSTKFGLVSENAATLLGDEPIIYTYVNP